MISFGFERVQKNTEPRLFRQIHSNKLVEVRNLEHVRTLRAAPPEADGAISQDPGVELFVYTADCLPVLLHAANKEEALAAIHAGWRGACAGIVENALDHFSQWKVKARAILGPAIRACCYEVKEDFIEAFRSQGHDPHIALTKRNGKWYFDLPTWVMKVPLKGIQTDSQSLTCTSCDPKGLPSFRREGLTDYQIRSHIRRNA